MIAGYRRPRSDRLPRRVAVLSVHTSPLEQPGTGDAGGMNVYIVQTSRRMAAAGVAVEIFTRATSSDLPPVAELAPGVTVRHVPAGPFEGLNKDDLPAQLCAFTADVLRAEARHEPGHYDVVHSHYWLSGQVGWLARQRWGVPLVHSAHTLARVKDAALADGEHPEPRTRVLTEQQVVHEADRLVTNTEVESAQLIKLYDADPAKVLTVPPGVDLERFAPGDQAAARTALGLPEDKVVLAFVGRIQPLKAPDVLLRAVAELHADRPELRDRLAVLIVGGPSGTGLGQPHALRELAAGLGIDAMTWFLSPRSGDRLAEVYRAADVVVVPSYSESFGLVALEAQACGTPVVAAAVGGLPVAVRNGVSGLLVDGHQPAAWAAQLGELVTSARLQATLAAGALAHARNFSWQRTTESLLAAYVDATAALRASLAAELSSEVAV